MFAIDGVVNKDHSTDIATRNGRRNMNTDKLRSEYIANQLIRSAPARAKWMEPSRAKRKPQRTGRRISLLALILGY